MWQVMILARLLAAVLGSNFETEWACWENTNPADAPYVCEWSEYPSDHPGGLYAVVWVDHEGAPVQWRIEPDPYAFALANLSVVSLDPAGQTLVMVETGDAPVYLSFGDGWLEVAGPLVDIGQMDPARLVLLPAGEGVVLFGSNGALFVAPYRVQPGPDPMQPA